MLPADSAQREAIAAHARRLKHDLGKYIAFRTRWLAGDAPHEEREQALRADLLATRRGPSGVSDAQDVWRGSRAVFFGEAPLVRDVRVSLAELPELRRVDQAMSALSVVIEALRAGPCDAAVVSQGILGAREVSDGCHALEQRLRVTRA